MSQEKNTKQTAKKKENAGARNKRPRIPFAIIKKQQELWSWLEFYTKLSSGGDSNKKAAEVTRQQLIDLEDANPGLYRTTFNNIDMPSAVDKQLAVQS